MSKIGQWSWTLVVVFLIGCEMPPTSRSFSHTMKDGSSFTISIDYKPNSQMVEDEKIGVYYFIARFHDAHSEAKLFKAPKPTRGLATILPPRPRLVRFCDEKGHLLFQYPQSLGLDTLMLRFLPLDRFAEDRIDGGYEWRGRFYEKNMTLENFRDIAYIEVWY